MISCKKCANYKGCTSDKDPLNCNFFTKSGVDIISDAISKQVIKNIDLKISKKDIRRG